MDKEEDKNKSADTENDSMSAISKDINALTTMTAENLANTGKQFAEMQKTLVNQQTLINDLAAKAKPVGISLPGVELEKDNFSIIKAVNAIKSGDWLNAGFEKEIFDNTRKTMSAGVGSEGGYLIPAEAIQDIIEMLSANTIVMALGATVLSGLVGSPVEMPKQTGGATAYWVDENAAIPTSDIKMGQINLNPHAMAAMVKMSNRLLKQSTPSAEGMIRRDIARVLALLFDLAALRGTGVESQPVGIINTSGINTVAIGTNGGDFTLDHAADMEGTLEDADALTGSLGFAMNGKVKRKLKKQKVAQFSGDTKGAYIMLPMSDANLIDMLGYNLKTSTQIPSDLEKGTGKNLSEVIFGNWQELIIGQWGGLEISASSETSDAFQKNQTWIKIIQEVDIAVRHPESFCLIKDAKTT